MKNLLFALSVCGLSLVSYAQSSSVERSIFNIQTGYFGLYFNNESRLTNNIALRSEIGLDAALWKNDFYNTSGFLMAPVITLEPRWYYNLKKRVNKNRRINNNSGNFIAIKTSYHPDWFTISNQDNTSIISDISIVPTWGIRRHIGKHFNYETGIGLGYGRYLIDDEDYFIGDRNVMVLNLHLRIGYTF